MSWNDSTGRIQNIRDFPFRHLLSTNSQNAHRMRCHPKALWLNFKRFCGFSNVPLSSKLSQHLSWLQCVDRFWCGQWWHAHWNADYLPIAEAKASIPGPSDIYVKMGSEVTITCIVSQGPHELGTIFWHRGNCCSTICYSTDGKCEWEIFGILFTKGASVIDPNFEYHPNDIFESPGRIAIDTEWTDALRSRWDYPIGMVTFSDATNRNRFFHSLSPPTDWRYPMRD